MHGARTIISFHTCEIFKALPNVATMWTNTRRRNTLISSNTLKSRSMSRPSRNEPVMLGIPSASKQMAVQHEANTFNLKIRFDDWVRAFSFSRPHSYPTNQRALARLRERINLYDICRNKTWNRNALMGRSLPRSDDGLNKVNHVYNCRI